MVSPRAYVYMYIYLVLFQHETFWVKHNGSMAVLYRHMGFICHGVLTSKMAILDLLLGVTTFKPSSEVFSMLQD